MARDTNSRRAGTGKQTKAQRIAAEVEKAVSAGKTWELETLDFSDPNRPASCLEVDFPIIPINQIAAIEGNAGKPIYQMSKWWARRRSSVFRAMLLAAATKAPTQPPGEAAKVVWKAYYGNHARKGAFKNLKVADIFMGGGTTLVEGSRLGMQMFGNDLNPVAWFVVKTELAQVQRKEVEALLKDIEAYVKPQIMPFYACRGPGGEKGKWIDVATGKAMGKDFDPLALKPEQRAAYRYEGPEIIYVFWSKHGPCQVTDCRHITPLMSTPKVSEKILTVKARSVTCKKCGMNFDAEDREARMAPDVPLAIMDDRPFATLDSAGGVTCPSCGEHFTPKAGIATKSKKVGLTLLMHPDWMYGCGPKDAKGNALGGSPTDDVDATVRWFKARASTLKLLEVRSAVKGGSKPTIDLPDEVKCPVTKKTVFTDNRGGTQAFRINKKDGKRTARKSSFACGANGHEHDMLDAIKASKKAGPVAPYVVQAYSPKLANGTAAYGGRYFLPADDTAQLEAAWREWNERKDGDLGAYWPRSVVPFGFMTGVANGDIREGHGFTHWWTMFNPRQLLVNALLLKAINEVGGEKHRWETREYVLAAFQQYVRNQNMFCFWDISRDCLAPHMSNNNYHPKSNLVENNVFHSLGRGNWASNAASLLETLEWRENPWDAVSNDRIVAEHATLGESLSGKGTKVFPGDPVGAQTTLHCGSATELKSLQAASHDLVVTDPPFGGLLHYSELADFFYVWLRLVLKQRYPDLFTPEYTPKTLEAVSNKARNGDDADAYYQRLLTESWREAHRILKPGGTLAFTFHHSEDAPWVQVLESLFEAGFYLECVFPIRSDEIKGEGEFGSKTIEFDIIHVCRKRLNEPTPISWPKLRRSVLQDVRELKDMLELHREQGLQEGDMQVIKRGKALEYFSRHYGQVYKDRNDKMGVLDALLGINLLLDEEGDSTRDHPPVNAEPFTRMLLRLFDGKTSLHQDQLQKFLRGTASSPADFEARGWVTHENKEYHLVSPLEIAQGWAGKQRKGIKSDYDQAMLLIGACYEGSGINANENLNNPNFEPHLALGDILVWHKTHGANDQMRKAATLASQLYKAWEAKNQAKLKQLSMFEKLGDEGGR